METETIKMIFSTEKKTIDNIFVEIDGKKFDALEVSNFLFELKEDTEIVGNLVNTWAYEDIIETMIKLKVASDKTTTRAIIKGKNFNEFRKEFEKKYYALRNNT